MTPRQKMKATSAQTKLIIASVTSILVSLAGAWGTQQAVGQDSGGISRGEVRQMIQNEAPVNSSDASRLFQTLNRIDNNITDIKINVAVGAAQTLQVKQQLAEVLLEQRRVRDQLAKTGAPK